MTNDTIVSSPNLLVRRILHRPFTQSSSKFLHPVFKDTHPPTVPIHAPILPICAPTYPSFPCSYLPVHASVLRVFPPTHQFSDFSQCFTDQHDIFLMHSQPHTYIPSTFS